MAKKSGEKPEKVSITDVKVDKVLYERFIVCCDNWGISKSDVIRVLMKMVVEGKFKISIDL